MINASKWESSAAYGPTPSGQLCCSPLQTVAPHSAAAAHRHPASEVAELFWEMSVCKVKRGDFRNSWIPDRYWPPHRGSIRSNKVRSGTGDKHYNKINIDAVSHRRRRGDPVRCSGKSNRQSISGVLIYKFPSHESACSHINTFKAAPTSAITRILTTPEH